MQGRFGWASSENYDGSPSQWLLKNGSQIPAKQSRTFTEQREKGLPAAHPMEKLLLPA